ncbi:DNA gyrase inhibitor YacG [Nordella sp. HKS 07]|uniref:DNA gyrase inhibitor YacG n=1 Tax=Nordella sp. HKS 07 TaxID=2712222 RepID=UPI0013E11BF7|nr:DNA gyrase inhibitor YacG [Nordella sp. HKS 07]QIG52143.1 DNA gyrase inhibitor YacG [Nordella sp. HKS 07]
MTGDTHPVRLRPRHPCPICGKPSQQKYHPFCSARCADVDLNRWFGGRYAIPAEEEPDPGDESPGPKRDEE